MIMVLVLGALATACMTVVGVVQARHRWRATTAATRHSAWVEIAARAPDGSRLTTVEADARMLFEVGQPRRTGEPHGGR